MRTFQVFHDKMREAQTEIRSTMSVNTNEAASKISSADGAKDPSAVRAKRSGTAPPLVAANRLPSIDTHSTSPVKPEETPKTRGL